METIKSRFSYLWKYNRNLVLAAIAGDIVITVIVVAVLWTIFA